MNMTQYIDKAIIVAEIERLIDKGKYSEEYDYAFRDGNNTVCNQILHFLDTLEVKEVKEYKQPEYSCFETAYKCGKKPHWNIGDVLTYYEFYSDREGEHVLGKVINVELDEEQSDWFYTFEDGSQYAEELLLEDETYTK